MEQASKKKDLLFKGSLLHRSEKREPLKRPNNSQFWSSRIRTYASSYQKRMPYPLAILHIEPIPLF